MMHHRSRQRLAEHHVQFRETEDEAVTSVDQGDVDLVRQLGQPSREFKPSETGTENHNPHGGRLAAHRPVDNSTTSDGPGT